MTRICFFGKDGHDIRVDLLSYETARQAIQPYSLSEPYVNSLCLETVSLGAAVSLLNDLNWYLVRLTDRAIIQEPSISQTEWLSRDLATAVRTEQVPPDETGDYLAIYGIVTPEEGRPYLTEPMFTQRVGDELPTYDLHEVDDTLLVRILPDEFSG